MAFEDTMTVSETLRTYDETSIFALDEHLDRLFKSAEILEIAQESSREQVEQALKKKVTENALPNQDLRIRILLDKTHFYFEMEPLREMPPEWYEQGIEVNDAMFERPNPRTKYPSTTYEFFAKKRSPEVFETLLFDRNGFLREGSISNVFAIFKAPPLEKGGAGGGFKIITPEKNILLGVTREKVIKLAKELGFQVEEREISREKLQTADEIFLTNTTKEVAPVRKWGEWENENFEVARTLKKAFQSIIPTPLNLTRQPHSTVKSREAQGQKTVEKQTKI